MTCYDTEHFDGLFNGNYFLSGNMYITAAALNCHSKCAWVIVFVRHTALQPKEQTQAESVCSEHL